MLSSIHLDYQFVFQADKVEDIITDHSLPHPYSHPPLEWEEIFKLAPMPQWGEGGGEGRIFHDFNITAKFVNSSRVRVSGLLRGSIPIFSILDPMDSGSESSECLSALINVFLR